MKIIPNQLIKQGYDKYEADQEYDVDDTLGSYFVMNGWARSEEYQPDVPPIPEATELEVDSATQGHEGEGL